MSRIAVTIDLDWATEPAIDDLLGYLQERGIRSTVFATHRSDRVYAGGEAVEVGLHPYFGAGSSHGRNIEEVVSHVLTLPHTLPAFRCHRFEVSNESRAAMAIAGMKVSSNVCTDLEVVPPFLERGGLLEVPVFFEDGGFLSRGHPLAITGRLERGLAGAGDAVLLLHPMHFALNTPRFDFMADIKRSLRRDEWRSLTRDDLSRLRWRGPGIRDVVTEILERFQETTTLGTIAQARLNRA